MAALIAHMLAVHQVAPGRHFAPPLDMAHIPVRIAHNVAYFNHLAWNLADPATGLGAYPSPLWIAIGTAFEWFTLPSARLYQLVGTLAALATIAISSMLVEDRKSGIVTPTLLVANGTFASCAASGTELPLVAFLLACSFVTFERGRTGLFGISTMLLVATGLEGLLMAGLFLCWTLLDTVAVRTPRAGVATPGGAALMWSPAVLVGFGCSLIPGRSGSSLYFERLLHMIEDAPLNARNGLDYVLDAGVTTISPFLIVLPLTLLISGRLSRVGRRALALGCAWSGLVVLAGGSALPFGQAVAPALPLLFLAVQQAMITIIDTRRRSLELATWALLGLVVGVSSLASKYPGNLGPLDFDAPHRAWMRAVALPPAGQRPVLGRLGVVDEMARVRDLARIALFLSRYGNPGDTILSPFPGILGQGTRMTVTDTFDRTGSARLTGTLAPPQPQVDLPALLAEKPELILPARRALELDETSSLFQRSDVTQPRNVALRAFLQPTKQAPPDALAPPEAEQVQRMLAEYELITLPLSLVAGRLNRNESMCYLLRRKDLGRSPRLDVRIESGPGGSEELVVCMQRTDHVTTGLEQVPPRPFPQIAQLSVFLLDDRGKRHYLDPLGNTSRERSVFARLNLIVSNGEPFETELFRARIPREVVSATPTAVTTYSIERVGAILVNPRTFPEMDLAPVSAEVTIAR